MTISEKAIWKYFPDLDAARFLAFLSVFIFHAINSSTMEYTADNLIYQLSRQLLLVGHKGDEFFFCLSSFLISYLLLKERNSFGEVNSKNFIIRRILRIWPLYFFFLAICLLMIPSVYQLMNPGDTVHLPDAQAFLLFYANFYMIKEYDFLFALTILWSISVEEQFYLLWAFVGKLNLKLFPLLCSAFIVISLVSHFTLEPGTVYIHSLSYEVHFGIGGLAAYFVFIEAKIIDSIRNLSRFVIALFYLAFIIVVLSYSYWESSYFMSFLEYSVFAVLFGFFILEQSFAKNSLFKLRHLPLLSWGGRLSYGLYVFHALALSVVGIGIGKYMNDTNLVVFVIKPILALMITIVLAWLSYRFLETPFLRIKERFRPS